MKGARWSAGTITIAILLSVVGVLLAALVTTFIRASDANEKRRDAEADKAELTSALEAKEKALADVVANRDRWKGKYEKLAAENPLWQKYGDFHLYKSFKVSKDGSEQAFQFGNCGSIQRPKPCVVVQMGRLADDPVPAIGTDDLIPAIEMEVRIFEMGDIRIPMKVPLRTGCQVIVASNPIEAIVIGVENDSFADAELALIVSEKRATPHDTIYGGPTYCIED